MDFCSKGNERLLIDSISSTISDNDVIVAIDFGTSRTGVVWGIRSIVPQRELEVQALDGAGVLTERDKKTLTAVLIDRNNENPIAYGYKARTKYSDDDQKENYFFKYFKMNLHNQFQIDPNIAAANNKRLPLSRIMHKSFEIIKNRVMETLNLRGIIIHKDPFNIIWSLTVPAIWTDVAKSIMRQSAFKAGMIESPTSDKLIIALEPECAFLGAMKSKENDQSVYAEKKRFLVVDCGAGTIDITGHEIQTIRPLTVKEIICPNGGHLGSTKIDDLFYEFLKEFLGENRYNEVIQTQEFIEMEKVWEDCKLSFSFDEFSDDITRINVANIFINNGLDSLNELVNNWNTRNPNFKIIKTGRQVIALPYNLLMTFFHKPIEDVINKVLEVYTQNINELRNLDYIILAGGFCRNLHLIKRMKEEFSDRKRIKVLHLRDPDLLIVRGAALFAASDNSIFKIRKAKYTFGLKHEIEYNGNSERHRRYKDNTFRTNDGKLRLLAFYAHGRIGDNIEVGKTITKCYVGPITNNQIDVNVDIYISSEYDPFYLKSATNTCLACANIPLDMSLPFNDRIICVEFSFGLTEVICSVYKGSGEFLRRILLDYKKFFDPV